MLKVLVIILMFWTMLGTAKPSPIVTAFHNCYRDFPAYFLVSAPISDCGGILTKSDCERVRIRYAGGFPLYFGHKRSRPRCLPSVYKFLDYFKVPIMDHGHVFGVWNYIFRYMSDHGKPERVFIDSCTRNGDITAAASIDEESFRYQFFLVHYESSSIKYPRVFQPNRPIFSDERKCAPSHRVIFALREVGYIDYFPIEGIGDVENARSEEKSRWPKRSDFAISIIWGRGITTSKSYSTVYGDNEEIRRSGRDKIGAMIDSLGNRTVQERCYKDNDFYELLSNQLYQTTVSVDAILYEGWRYERRGNLWCGTQKP
jgi:hypothetical protein